MLAASPTFEVRDCSPDAAAAGARCGVVYVPENHAKPRGRKIGLKVLVLPATNAADHSRAQYDLEGGPGFGITDILAFYASEGAAYRRTRDIVLADMRGTGGSNPLRCAGIEERDKRQPLAPMYPPDLVAECAQQVSVASDPARYTTAAAAKDIDLVRRALGYDKLDLVALSYGTTLALRYLADFPKHVHAAALMGTVPADKTPPRFHAGAAESSLKQLAVACRADRECTQKFGDVDANLEAMRVRAGSTPGLTPGTVMEKLRTWLYAPETRAHVPARLQRAAQGDFGDFTGQTTPRVFADGLYLSITCAETYGEIDVDAAIAAARATRFGAYRLERQRDACGHWPRAPRDPKLLRPDASGLPVLFITGELDPVAPMQWTLELAKRFPASRVAVAPQGAHVFDGLSGQDTCLDATIIRLFDTGDALGLDVSCFAGMEPQPAGFQP
jgi:pimeloyl-ACP methyl ester carboxylesterase